jgi:hypothetical protein
MVIPVIIVVHANLDTCFLRPWIRHDCRWSKDGFRSLGVAIHWKSAVTAQTFRRLSPQSSYEI